MRFSLISLVLAVAALVWAGGSRPGEGGRQIVPEAYRILDTIEGEPASIEAVVIIREDRLEMIVGGYVTRNGGRQLLLGRYNLGNLRRDWRVVIDVIGSESEQIFDIALDDQNRIVAVGTGLFGGTGRCIVMRYHYNGRVDESFGNRGLKIVHFEDQDIREVGCTSLLVSPDYGRWDRYIELGGGIVIPDLGEGDRGIYPLRTALNANGENSWSELASLEGPVLFDFLRVGEPCAVIQDMVRSNDGLLLAIAGGDCAGVPEKFILYRKRRLTTLYEERGPITKTTFEDFSVPTAVAIDSQNRIIVGGYTIEDGGEYGGWEFKFALARYLADGTPDNSFSGDGKRTVDFPTAPNAAPSAAILDLLIDPQDRILAVGLAGNFNLPFTGGFNSGSFKTHPDLIFSSPNARLALARISTDGRMNRSFNGDGRLLTDLSESQTEKLKAIARRHQFYYGVGAAAGHPLITRYVLMDEETIVTGFGTPEEEPAGLQKREEPQGEIRVVVRADSDEEDENPPPADDGDDGGVRPGDGRPGGGLGDDDEARDDGDFDLLPDDDERADAGSPAPGSSGGGARPPVGIPPQDIFTQEGTFGDDTDEPPPAPSDKGGGGCHLILR